MCLKKCQKSSLRPPYPTPGAPNFFVTLAGGAISKKRGEKKAREEVLALLLHYTDCCWHPRFLKNGKGKKTWIFLSSLRGGGGPPNVFNRKKKREKEKNIYFLAPAPPIYLFLLPVWKMSPGFLPLIPPPTQPSRHARLDTSGKNKLERKKFLRKLGILWAGEGGGIPKKQFEPPRVCSRDFIIIFFLRGRGAGARDYLNRKPKDFGVRVSGIYPSNFIAHTCPPLPNILIPPRIGYPFPPFFSGCTKTPSIFRAAATAAAKAK